MRPAQCAWSLALPSGFAVDMQFTALDTEPTYDVVTVTGIFAAGTTTLGSVSFSGNSTRTIPRCFGQCAVSFSSDSNDERTGFTIAFADVRVGCDTMSHPAQAIAAAPAVFGPTCAYVPAISGATSVLRAAAPELAGASLAGRQPLLVGLCVRPVVAGTSGAVVVSIVANDTATLEAFIAGNQALAVWSVHVNGTRAAPSCSAEAQTAAATVATPPPQGFALVLQASPGTPALGTLAVAYVLSCGPCVHGTCAMSAQSSFVCNCIDGYIGVACDAVRPSCNGTTVLNLASSPVQIDDGGTGTSLYAPQTLCRWTVYAANASSLVSVSLQRLNLSSTFVHYDSIAFAQPSALGGTVLASLVGTATTTGWSIVSPGPALEIDFTGVLGGGRGFSLSLRSVPNKSFPSSELLYFTHTPARVSNELSAVFQIGCPLGPGRCCFTTQLAKSDGSRVTNSTPTCNNTLSFRVVSGFSYCLDANSSLLSPSRRSLNGLTYTWSVFVGKPEITSHRTLAGLSTEASPAVSLVCSEGPICCFVASMWLRNTSSSATITQYWCDGTYLPPLPLGMWANVSASAYPLDVAGNTGATVELGSWEYDSLVPVASFVGIMPTAYNENVRVFKLQCLPEAYPCSYAFSSNGGPYTSLATSSASASAAAGARAIDTQLVSSPPLFVAPPTDAAFTFSAGNGTASKFVFTLDGVLQPPLFASTHSLVLKAADLAIGNHTLAVTAYDMSGTADPSPVQFTWTIADAGGPTVHITSGPANQTSSPWGVLQLRTAAGYVEYFQYCVDSTAACNRTSSPTLVVRVSSNGAGGGREPHYVRVRGVDFAGYAGPWVTHSWLVDERNTPLTFAVTPQNGTLSSDDSYAVVDIAPDTRLCVHGVQAALDAGSWVLHTEGVILIPPLMPGVHSLAVRALTCAGVASYSQSVVFEVVAAVVPPAVSILSGPSKNVTSSSAVFVIAPEAPIDPVTQLQYSMDTGLLRDWTPCFATLAMAALQPGTHHIAFRAARRGIVSPHATVFEWTITVALGSDSFAVDVLQDGLASVSVIATDRAGNVQLAPTTFSWVLDTVAPSSTAALSSPAITRALNVSISFHATEQCSVSYQVVAPGGVLGDLAQVLLSAPCGVGGDSCASQIVQFTGGNGMYGLAFYAVDPAGNTEVEHYVSSMWQLDTVPPIVTVSSQTPANGAYADHDAVSASLGCSKAPPCAFEFQTAVGGVVTASGWVSTGWQFLAPGLRDGFYTFNFRATDAAGNVGQAPYAAYTPIVDASAPAASIVSGPAAGAWVANATVTFGFACNKLSGCTYLTTVGSLPGVTSSTATLVLRLADGPQVVSVRAVTPRATESEPNAFVRTFNVDTLPPRNQFGARPPPYCGPHSPAAAFLVNVSAASVQDAVLYNIKARAAAGSSVPLAQWNSVSIFSTLNIVGGLVANTNYSLELRGIDSAGNVQLVPDAVVFYYDAAIPVVSVAPGFAVVSNATSRFVSFTVSDVAPVTLSLTPGAGVTLAATTLLAPYVVSMSSGTSDGQYSFSFRAADAAGNVQLSASTVSWTLDRTPPAVHLVSTPPMYRLGTASSSTVLSAICTDLNKCFLQYTLTVLAIPTGGCMNSAALLAAVTFNDGASSRMPGVSYTLPANALFTVTPSSDGKFQVVFVPIDAAGNTGPSASVTWVIDTVAPLAPVFVSAPRAVDSASARNFTVAPGNPGQDDDSLGGIFYEFLLDSGATWTPTTPTPVSGVGPHAFSAPPLSEGTHSIRVRVRDTSGNIGPPVWMSWQVESSTPHTVITLQPAPVIGVSIAYFLVQSQSRTTNELLRYSKFQVDTGGVNGFSDVSCKRNRTIAYAENEMLPGTASYDAGSSNATTGACVVGVLLSATGTHTFQIRAVTAAGVADVSPVVTTFVYAHCASTQYAAILSATGALTCTNCAVGADCRDPTTTFATMVALPGYWSVPASANFYACRRAAACLGGVPGPGAGVRSVCAAGYTGVLCDVCAPGYYLALSSCMPCPASVGVAWTYIGVVIFCLFLSALLVFKWQKLMPKQYMCARACAA
jgi:hypothetical protein